jgi:UDP-glucuronate 4-epimerase
MRVLVTGGAGFIASTLIHALLARGDEVVTVDNLSPYYDPTLKEARLARFEGKVAIERIDITDHDALEEVFKKYQFDKIAHLAAQAGVRHSLEHPDTYVQTNYVGTFNIFDLAKKYGAKDIVFASTSSVYGNAKKFPTNEDEPSDRPLTIYAASKRACEMMAAHYNYAYGLNITCLRFFTVYGPWGRPDMALFKFTKGILEGTPIDIYNGGEMNRDFTYVDDIVDGFVAALGKPLGFEIINIGHGHPEKLLHFIEIIERELGKKAVRNMLPMQLGDVPASFADTEKAKKLLSVSAKVSIEEGVPRFIKWYREYYKV